MKILKPLVCLLFLSFVFTSCSNDDDAVSVSPEEKIVGLWEIYEITINDETQELGVCEQKQALEFKANGEMVVTSSFLFEGDCQVVIVSGQWAYQENNIFQLKLTEIVEFPEVPEEDIEIELPQTTVDEIIFSETEAGGTIFTVVEEETAGDITTYTYLKV